MVGLDSSNVVLLVGVRIILIQDARPGRVRALSDQHVAVRQPEKASTADGGSCLQLLCDWLFSKACIVSFTGGRLYTQR